jgi:hypothetical protein
MTWAEAQFDGAALRMNVSSTVKAKVKKLVQAVRQWRNHRTGTIWLNVPESVIKPRLRPAYARSARRKIR